MIDRERDEQIVQDLLEGASAGTESRDPSLRRYCVSALSGMTGEQGFRGALGLLESEDHDPEIWRLAMAVTSRHWWQVWQEGRIAEFSTQLVLQWADSVAQSLDHVTTSRNTRRFSQSLFMLVAWTLLDREGDEGARTLLDASGPSTHPGYDDVSRYLDEFQNTDASMAFKGTELVKDFLARVNRDEPYYYQDNLWSGTTEGTTETRRLAPDENATSAEIRFFWLSTGEYMTSGLVTSISWKACKPDADGTSLQFSSNDKSELIVTCDLPRYPCRAHVKFEHAASNRVMLPGFGFAEVEFSLADGQHLLTRELPIEESEGLSFSISAPQVEQARDRSGQLSLVLKSISGNTTYRVYSIRIEFEPR